MSLLGKDPIQWDDTIQLRKVHGAGRAEDYQTAELYERFNLHRILPGVGEPQMAEPATSEGVENPIDFTAAFAGALGNNLMIDIQLAEFEEGDTDKVKIRLVGDFTFFLTIAAEGSEGDLVTVVTVGDLLTALGADEDFSVYATAVLQDGGNDSTPLVNDLFIFTGGIDAEPADIGKRMTVIDNDEFAGEYLCFNPTEPDSDTLAEHWILINEPSPAKGAAQSPPKK